MGNCGFTAAPLANDKAAQMEMIKIFSFFEDIPLEPVQGGDKTSHWNASEVLSVAE